MDADFHFVSHGSICTLQPMTLEASQWLEDHTDPSAQYWGAALVVEPRYVAPLLDGIYQDGLTV